ncbi:hypothetical protein ASPSYDRAFT_252187 [Aspergillus sydowii CBS 593.65]|uniref:Uncharacterized protein n=1 Tax=Aspergillus sydowii CBS 593.65 TaxID=1036612 RepID=A0A1L9TW63_9EURO|nr:uncharacterized protein ASPSYDRAFT_252187 [Aspergillus sydowii CBS 593.65]OJJ63669.1 hypothetical protein ASPSYDRAFT_252187 [Aspergillus sydowii CBS 593.65]
MARSRPERWVQALQWNGRIGGWGRGCAQANRSRLASWAVVLLVPPPALTFKKSTAYLGSDWHPAGRRSGNPGPGTGPDWRAALFDFARHCPCSWGSSSLFSFQMCSSRKKKKAWIELLSLDENVRQSFDPRCAAVPFQIIISVSFVAGRRNCASADCWDSAQSPSTSEQNIPSVPSPSLIRSEDYNATSLFWQLCRFYRPAVAAVSTEQTLSRAGVLFPLQAPNLYDCAGGAGISRYYWKTVPSKVSCKTAGIGQKHWPALLSDAQTSPKTWALGMHSIRRLGYEFPDLRDSIFIFIQQ